MIKIHVNEDDIDNLMANGEAQVETEDGVAAVLIYDGDLDDGVRI